MGIVASSARSVDILEPGAGTENRGAGGNGRLGLPPYRDEGVPGRGLPFRSAGSYWIDDGGRFPASDPTRGGDHDLVGDARPGEYALYAGASEGGGMTGALPRIDGDRDRGMDAVAEGKYERWGEVSLLDLGGKRGVLNASLTLGRRWGEDSFCPVCFFGAETCAIVDHVWESARD
jgi:hypothetical protein